MAGVISEHEEQAVVGRAAKVLAVSDCIQAVSRNDTIPLMKYMSSSITSGDSYFL
jgi:hypothetical protein